MAIRIKADKNGVNTRVFSDGVDITDKLQVSKITVAPIEGKSYVTATLVCMADVDVTVLPENITVNVEPQPRAENIAHLNFEGIIPPEQIASIRKHMTKHGKQKTDCDECVLQHICTIEQQAKVQKRKQDHSGDALPYHSANEPKSAQEEHDARARKKRMEKAQEQLDDDLALAKGMNMPEPKETIVGCAIKHAGMIVSKPLPTDHGVIQSGLAQLAPLYMVSEAYIPYGFTTSKGRFVDRHEAANIARASGQAIYSVIGHRGLSSENVNHSDYYKQFIPKNSK